MKNWTILWMLALVILLTACSDRENEAAMTVEEYLTALVSQNSEKISSISCKDWEPNALLEIDSFQAVKASLEGMSCEQTGQEGDISMVVCKGKIMASYNEEQQEFDLSARTYEVVEEGGEMRVCGYH